MSKKNYDVYFDFGSSKIRVGAFDKDNLKKDFYCESNNFLDQSNLETYIQKIIFDLEKKTEEYLDEVNLLIDNSKMLSVGISLSKKIDKLELKKEDIQFLVQDAKQQILRNYSNYNIIHIIIKNYRVDNIDYIFPPTKINCNLLSLDIIFLCFPKENISYIKKIFSKFHVSIKQIYCSSYIKSFNYKDNYSSINNLSFIDIGFYKTSIINYNKNQICFFQFLPIGSHHITKDLSKILKISIEEAEKIKISFGVNNSYFIEKNLSQDLIEKIIISRIEEILKFSIKSIKLNNNNEQLEDSKVVLIGEGSKILSNKFNHKISYLENHDILNEKTKDICLSALKFNKDKNIQEVVVIPKKQIKVGFFEKLFHLFHEK
tara:strand:+ start:253 stop:1374 length:1122 start_codon:yes stop_codon:yes gene_type:complete